MVHKNNSRTRKYIGGSDSGKHVGKKSESNTVGKKIKGKKSKKKGNISLLNDSSASHSLRTSLARSFAGLLCFEGLAIPSGRFVASRTRGSSKLPR